MIRRLQKRMILLVLSGLLLASAGLVIAINWINWHSLVSQSQGILSMLAENEGFRPPENEAIPPETEGSLPKDRPEVMGEGSFRQGRNDFFRGRGTDTRSAANLSSIYTIILNAEGGVETWSSDRPGLYSDADIAALAEYACACGGDSGRYGDQFYHMVKENGTTRMTVLDQRLAVQDARRVLLLTVLTALLEDALLSLGAILLIRRMIRPVDEAMEKQKQFVWDASHELKTPLAVISANAQVLADELPQSKPLSYIQSEVERTDRLIQNLLTLARMEKGSVQAQIVPFDMSRTLLSVALPFESTVFEDGKQLVMQVPNGITARGDEEMIKQLCVILLSNAQKYSGTGDTITLSLEEKGDKRIMTVHNTGSYIPPEAQNRIFDRFYRADTSHNREVPGNGLGLAIARSIVQAHHGRIAVQSSPEAGTSFTVTL